MTDVRALLSELSKRPVSYFPVFVDITGSVTAGVMLSQAMYWQERVDEDGWFYKKQSEWWDETRLTRREQEGARKKLRSITVDGEHLWEEDKKGTPAKLYFRVNLDLLASLIAQNRHTGMAETATQDVRKAPNLHTEITTETTAENLSSPSASPQSTDTDDEQFDIFWNRYPKKQAKAAAKKAFAKAIKKTDLDTMLAAINQQSQTRKWHEGYIPMPTTWLNQERWDDEVGHEPAQKSPHNKTGRFSQAPIEADRKAKEDNYPRDADGDRIVVHTKTGTPFKWFEGMKHPNDMTREELNHGKKPGDKGYFYEDGSFIANSGKRFFHDEDGMIHPYERMGRL